MATTATQDRARKAGAPAEKRNGNGAHAPVLVSGYKLAVHFGVARQSVDQLAAQGIIERQRNGMFDLDASRLRYFEHLRSERKRSPRSDADASFTQAKASLIQIRIMEKQKTLMLAEDHASRVESIVGLVLTHLGGWPARIAGHDLGLRRKADALVFELRKEVTEAAHLLGDQEGEPEIER